ncbi:D-aminoacylase [Arthrobacter sp. AQ5-06]|nr:D-aminoacylase [Arthrobacter sp. AQ5-06]
MASWVLRGGSVIDGLGGPRYAADVLISDGRIGGIISPGQAAAGDDIDVAGLVVAPGFIDMHAHSDLAVLADPAHVSKAAQGITLEVVGQDGLGYAPVNDEVMAATREQIAGWNGTPDLDYSWRSIADYLAEVDKGAAVNVAVLVPHGTARMIVMGTQSRAAAPAELLKIRDIIAQGLQDGAMGMSTGLTYTPGMYASDEELVHALAAVRDIGGYYCPHHRNYGIDVVDGYRACIDIVKEAGVPLHLAHCHINFPQNKGRAAEVLAALDEAMAAGVDITLDSYPYLAGATYLAALLPSWVHEGGQEAMSDRLADRGTRGRILHEIEVLGSDGHHGVPMDWTTVVIASTQRPENAWAVGKTVAEMAGERAPAGDAFLDLLVADNFGAGCLVQVGNEENVQAVMRHSAHTVGSDGILVGERPHPRGWGTFPRFLGHYARELGIMSLEEAVLHATSRPARRLGLADRGVVAEGNWADLVVFDPDAVGSRATYENPRVLPDGIHYVFVNGEPTIERGSRTDARPGRAVRRA